MFIAPFAQSHLEIYIAYCTLPRATLGIDVICWYYNDNLVTNKQVGNFPGTRVEILNLHGTNLSSGMGAGNIPPPQDQPVYRYEMDDGTKQPGLGTMM